MTDPLTILDKHKRHVEASPGVGAHAQSYALSVIEDIRNDFSALASHAAVRDRVQWEPTHQHYRGGLYRRLYSARHSETLEDLTIYENENGDVWVRPTDMFEQLLGDGTPRFRALKGAPT